MTSAGIRVKTLVIARAMCVISRVQNGTPELTHKGCVLQRVSLGALGDMVVLGMRQSIGTSSVLIVHNILHTVDLTHDISPNHNSDN